ncbi:unnamed protein product [Caenorhabditis brenneri]
MDIVVVLALVVLGFVFILSLIILVITCQRRRHSHAKSKILVPFENPPIRFSRNATAADTVDNIETMEQLNFLLTELLDKNEWLFEARGIMQHVIAVLTLTRSVTSKLAEVEPPVARTPFHDAITMAMRNIYPRFDDLIESIAAQPIDMRLLEARALSLGTVTWSLYLPYTLLDPNNKEEIQQPLNQLNLHLVTIRTAAHLISMAEKGAEDKLDAVDFKDHLMRIRRQIRGDTVLEDTVATKAEAARRRSSVEHADVDDNDEDDEDDDDEESHDPNGLVDKRLLLSASDHEKMPLVESEAIIDMIELSRVPLIEQEHLLKSNGVSDGNHKQTPLHHLHHHHHHHPHHMTNGSLNTVEEINEDDHHGEGTSTSCSSSSTSSASSSSSTHQIDPKA